VACPRVLCLVRGTYRYNSHQKERTELWAPIREIAQSRMRYGYRKILVLLRRKGWIVGKHLAYRVYREEGLALKKRPQKLRKAVKHREERFLAKEPNEGRSIDFDADQLQDGLRFRALTIVDMFSRESIAIEVGQSLRGEDVVLTLNRLKHEGRTLKLLFCDNGPEFTGQLLDLWAYRNGVKIDFSRPASRPTTPSWNRSMEPSGQSAWTQTGSRLWPTQNRSSMPSGTNTMRVALVGLWPTGHRRNSPARSRLIATWLKPKQAES